MSAVDKHTYIHTYIRTQLPLISLPTIGGYIYLIRHFVNRSQQLPSDIISVVSRHRYFNFKVISMWWLENVGILIRCRYYWRVRSYYRINLF